MFFETKEPLVRVQATECERVGFDMGWAIWQGCLKHDENGDGGKQR